MRKNILLISLLLFIISFSLNVKVIAEFDAQDIIAENEYLILYMNRDDTALAVQCKTSNKIWSTNPAERNQARAGLKERMSSQLNIIHDPKNVTKENYDYSNKFGTFEIIPIDNGVRVEYLFVEQWTANDYLPQLVSASRFEEKVLNQLEERDKENIRTNYYLLKLRKLEEDEEHIEIKGLLLEEIFAEYTLDILEDNHQKLLVERDKLKNELEELQASIGQPGNEKKDEDVKSKIVTIEKKLQGLDRDLQWEREDITWHLINLIVDNRADIDLIEDISFQDISQLVDTPTYMRKNIPRFNLPRLSEAVEKAGYSPLDATEDHIANNLNPSVPNLEIFEVPIEYRLDKDNLLVTIPVDEVKYPIEVLDFAGDENTFPIVFLEVLPYFSAAGLEEEGYIFVPDGSGALIYLNNGKLYAPPYNQAVYGRDLTEDPPNYQTTYTNLAHLPVFGLKKGDQAFLGIIESGDAIAHIRADVSGRRDDFNRVFPRFNINKAGKIYLDHGGELDIYQPVMYQGDIQIRYQFFTGEEANYSAMAGRYQEYLVDKNVLTPLTEGHPPVLIDIIGAFPRQEVVMGIPRKRSYPATTFEDVKVIFDKLANEGLENIHLRYRGWLQGGLEHLYPKKVSIENSLGTKDEFRELIKHIKENNGTIYPDVGFLNVFQDRLFDGFSSTKDAARRLDRLPAKVYSYNRATFARDADLGYIVSPRILEKLVLGFMSDFNSYGAEGISLSQMGWQLNSDFRRSAGDMIDRQQASKIISSQLASIAKSNSIMIEGGNLYSLPFASTIVNMPLEDSGYDIVDDRIPFYQMVVSGYINYAGEAMNQISDKEHYALLSLETGALPYYTLAAAKSEVVKGTRHAQLYSLSFEQWQNKIVSNYYEMLPIYKQIHDKKFTHHEILDDGVTKSTYENGVSIIVNYNFYPIEYNGVVIGARDFYLQK